MWELFQKILKEKLTPNQTLILFGMKNKVALPLSKQEDKEALVNLGYLNLEGDVYKLTPQAKLFMVRLDNYFIKAKKKTDIQLMGKNHVDKINAYREIFPAKKLPSGMYVNEYRDTEYLYMQTSQYFICKQDKHRVKHSTLADYCDMILEGVNTEDEHFKENVV